LRIIFVKSETNIFVKLDVIKILYRFVRHFNITIRDSY